MHPQPPAPTAADAAVGPAPASGRRAAAVSTLLSSGVSVAITVAQAFVVIPLALLHIGPVVYGGWIAASEVLIWLQLLDFGIPNLAAQRVGATLGGGDTGLARRWATSSILAVSLISAALTLLVLSLGAIVATWARVPADASQLFVAAFGLATLASGMLMWYHGVLGVARGAQRTTFLSVVQVVGAIIGFFVSVTYLTGGYHVLALALGLAARAVICAGGALVFLLCGRRVNGVGLGSPSLAVLGEIVRLAPAMTGANVAYLVSNHTEVALVTTVFGPGAAAVYSLTRRAFDGLRQLLDVIAFSVYGGFAHLVAAADKYRARAVLNEILLARLAVAALAAAIAAAVNRPFVALLFGPENYGGGWMNAGFAIQLVIGGQAFLCSYLLRAAGRIAEGSAIAALEAMARVAAIGVALWTLGPASVPWAAALASVGAVVVAQRRLNAILPPAPPGLARERRVRWSVPALAVAGGIALGLAPLPRTWLTVLVLSAVVLGGGGLLLRTTLPATSRAQLDRWLRWLMASGPPPPSSPPARISIFWRLLPGAVFLTYFVSTALLFFFGPWNYTLGPGIGRLIFFLIAVHTAFAAGYWLGARGRPAAARLPVQVGTIVFVAALVELLLIVPTSLHNTGRWIPMPWATLQDIGGAYTGSILRRESQTPYVNYLRILLSPLLTVAVPLGVFYWRRLARVTRLVLIASVLGTISLYVDIGANAGIAHWVGLFPWLIVAAHLSGVQPLDRARWTRLALILAASGLVFALIFGTAMVNRRGSYAVYGFLPGIGAHVDRPFVPQPAAVIAARGLAAYLTQGYYAIYLSLSEPFVPCYGVGNSMFLQRQAARITGNAYFLSCSYPTRIEPKGWHALRYWATIYPWLASDVTFPGTIVIIFAVGWIAARVWLDALGGANPLAVAFLGQMLLVLYYVPAHNKLMQSGEGVFGFAALLALWAVTRRRRLQS